MTRRTVALAIFVKTPELSPIKTRLAERMGYDAALEFYKLSLNAVAATAAQVQSEDVVPCWAVAEEAGLAHPLWGRFGRIWQGTGDLGDRLNCVFSLLRRTHDAVIAIGADSPQITPQLLATACRQLLNAAGQAENVLGRCHDGGFYLVGTNIPQPAETWRGVPYSTSSAAEQMAVRLAATGALVELKQITDVDRAEDLFVLRDELAAIVGATPEQVALLEWLAQREKTQDLHASRK